MRRKEIYSGTFRLHLLHLPGEEKKSIPLPIAFQIASKRRQVDRNSRQPCWGQP